MLETEKVAELKKACRQNNLDVVKELLIGKEFGPYDTKGLQDAYLIACANKSNAVIQYLMTSKDFKPNPRSVRGLERIFADKNEEMIRWLIFDFDMQKSAAVEEVLIEMTDKEYAKYIEELFTKRQLKKELNKELEEGLKKQQNKV